VGRMPELPEISAHAERLTSRYAGAALAAFEPLAFTALKTAAPAPEAALGSTLRGVGRRGKHLLLDFGDLTFVTHLMQGGRLRHDERRTRRPRGGVARWVFDDGRALLLTEAGTERRAGVWLVAGDPATQPPLSALGPDADTLDEQHVAALLRGASMRLHTWLRDQSVLAGLGRRLANEVCHRARLSPFAQTRQLGADDAAAVAAAVRALLDEGLEAERARDDMSASKERPGAVHGRVGEACPVCGDVVSAVAYRDYTVCYCAACQTGGRVLADNTTSKFLR
jgi:formamidopyrimidine-DNA glycosylase